MPSPDDPVFTGICGLSLGHPDEYIEGQIVSAEEHRAAAQRRFAQELGVNFRDVKGRTAYLRIFTRQDVWDDYGYDRVNDDLFDDDGWQVKWDRERTPEFYYIGPDGKEYDEYGGPEAPEVVPDDWEPDDYDPVWTFCDKNHPNAIKVLVFEEK